MYSKKILSRVAAGESSSGMIAEIIDKSGMGQETIKSGAILKSHTSKIFTINNLDVAPDTNKGLKKCG